MEKQIHAILHCLRWECMQVPDQQRLPPLFSFFSPRVGSKADNLQRKHHNNNRNKEAARWTHGHPFSTTLVLRPGQLGTDVLWSQKQK